MPRKPARSEAASFAASLPDAYLSCRDYGHSWRAHMAAFDRKELCWGRTLRCVRCGTERVQYLSQTGSILSGRYQYPEGYQHKGLGRLDGSDRDALRLESVVRVAHDAQSKAS